MIVFGSNRKYGNYEIYAMDFNGRNTVRITYNKNIDSYPAVSNDGSKILITRYQSPTKTDIVLYQNRKEKTLIKGSELNRTSTHSWSPDGERFVYISNKGDGISRLYIFDLNDNTQIQLPPHHVDSFAWSPDGEQATYTSGGNLFVINLETNEMQKITETGVYSATTWVGSKDIVATKNVEGGRCLTHLDLLTKNERPLTNPDESDDLFNTTGCFLDFDAVLMDDLPVNGKDRLVYTGWETQRTGGTFQLFTINWDGTGSKMITDQSDNLTPSVARR